MTNDNNELKNNAPCEEKQEARQLTEEELEKVTGGSDDIVDFISMVYETVTKPLKQAEEEKDKLLASIIKQSQPREKRDR